LGSIVIAHVITADAYHPINHAVGWNGPRADGHI